MSKVETVTLPLSQTGCNNLQLDSYSLKIQDFISRSQYQEVVDRVNKIHRKYTTVFVFSIIGMIFFAILPTFSGLVVSVVEFVAPMSKQRNGEPVFMPNQPQMVQPQGQPMMVPMQQNQQQMQMQQNQQQMQMQQPMMMPMQQNQQMNYQQNDINPAIAYDNGDDLMK
eukprot:TRINITY_DN3248_c0_g1_i2.p1 TRINITY_DN3248_c0_g1~~TRINITY_DN3248_c0_g1_i2.p1  ORF type:complete len:168 (-),score=39.42 TRINITY_DN3248_c0_g1_i2:385-888(-)